MLVSFHEENAGSKENERKFHITCRNRSNSLAKRVPEKTWPRSRKDFMLKCYASFVCFISVLFIFIPRVLLLYLLAFFGDCSGSFYTHLRRDFSIPNRKLKILTMTGWRNHSLDYFHIPFCVKRNAKIKSRYIFAFYEKSFKQFQIYENGLSCKRCTINWMNIHVS
jgi:hypothetical protein